MFDIGFSLKGISRDPVAFDTLQPGRMLGAVLSPLDASRMRDPDRIVVWSHRRLPNGDHERTTKLGHTYTTRGAPS